MFWRAPQSSAWVCGRLFSLTNQVRNAVVRSWWLTKERFHWLTTVPETTATINEAPSYFSLILTFYSPISSLLFRHPRLLSVLTYILFFDREASNCRLGRWRKKGHSTQRALNLPASPKPRGSMPIYWKSYKPQSWKIRRSTWPSNSPRNIRNVSWKWENQLKALRVSTTIPQFSLSSLA